MTIKEVEQLLEIPRATVRFYEKEGLVNPGRKGNGYRDYTDEDVEKLRKVIILRKISISVEDINDIFDGIKSMNEVLNTNIINLQQQMDELKGAINLSKKMRKDDVEISSLDTGRYWNTINEEEKQGNSFIDIADIEKGVIFKYFSWADGKTYNSLAKCIRDIIIAIIITGCLVCIMEKEWTFHNFLGGLTGILIIIIIEVVISVPLYFIGKKFAWVNNNRKKILIITCIVLALILLSQ